MARVNGVPILTGALWDAVMEKSQVIFGTFKREEDVQITVVIISMKNIDIKNE